MLSSDELKRRIHAARILRDVSQVELQAKLADDGLGKRELGRIERGELPLTKVRRVALASALGVPEAWFQVEDVDEMLGLTASRPQPADGAPQPPGELFHRLADAPPTAQDLPTDENQPGEEKRSNGGE